VPPWLVLGLEVALEAATHRSADPAGRGLATRDVTAARLAEDAARHFLAWTCRCRDEGFGPVRDAWNARCYRRGAEATFEVAGERRSGVVGGLDEDGSLRVGGAALPLEAAMAEQG
jgi:biotin-(acetyl-CoA carboxylase) ligase